jgi:SAM-dependent methyltransferase/methyltransferase-like protein
MPEPLQFDRPISLTDYDEVPYPGKFYPQSAPGRLATMAALFDLAAPDITECRVLELGCGDGGNLIPLAFYLPQSQFVGVDLSSTAIARGHSRIAELKLTNLQLCAQNLLDFSADAGTFDYIIAHGIYSWIPAEARQQLLTICARHLATNGVAYISYNALPGGYLRRYPRELMLFHTRAITDPDTRIIESRNVLEFILSAFPAQTMERELLRRELASSKRSDAFMYHDILSETNEPVYFLDFLDKAAAHGLQFLAESDPHSMSTAHFSESFRTEMDALPDRRIREQYIDFVYCRRFRQTLLCRTGHNLASTLNADALDRLWIAGSLAPDKTSREINETDAVVFHTPRGITVKAIEAIPKAVYLTLNDHYPHALRYEELVVRALNRIGIDRGSLSAAVEGKIVRMLMSSFVNGAVELRAFRPALAEAISERPVASALSRSQAAQPSNIVSCLFAAHALEHPLQGRLLTLLDGTRNRQQLASELSTTCEHVEASLSSLFRLGLLVN